MKKLLLFVITIIYLTGCGTQQDNIENTSNNSNELSDESLLGDINEVTGTYEGQIDTNSIEIITADGPLALRINEETEESLSELKEGDTVVVRYIQNDNGQLILEEINK
ncbi:hypothetical protein V7147_02730 [Bacillus sp. JJ1521]|uniref:hypothetical protein n=1 Tax=Bacillus sp. JJ1521 TaxID=3122957 RepID=UPI002FFE06D6